MTYDLLSYLREQIDRAVDAGLTKRLIIAALRDAIDEVESDEEIPA